MQFYWAHWDIENDLRINEYNWKFFRLLEGEDNAEFTPKEYSQEYIKMIKNYNMFYTVSQFTIYNI